MKKRYKTPITIFIAILFIGNLFWFTISISGQQEPQKTEYEGKLVCEHEDIVTNDQWQWFKLIVELGDEVTVTLDYSGDLDLDLYAYWKRDNPPEFNGFDLTHCPKLDGDGNETYPIADYSQFRTNDTEDLDQPEEIYLENPTFRDREDQKAYILVFVHAGVGESEYTLNSNKEFMLIDHDDVYDCHYTSTVLMGYLVTACVVLGLSIYIIRRKKKKILKPPEEEKPKEKDKEIIDLNSQI